MKSYLLAALMCFISVAYGDVCLPTSDFTFLSQNRNIQVGGNSITIRGLNWWGMETSTYTLGGLQNHPMTYYLDFMQQNGFNGLRIPFNQDMALNPQSRYPQAINYGLDSTLQGMTATDVLEQLFIRAAARGIVILLDQHHFSANDPAGDADPVWYSDQGCITNPDGVCFSYTIQTETAAWNYLVHRFQKYWNFLGCDLNNEPHYQARWANGDPTTDWAMATGQMGNSIINSNPGYNGLIFVEGVQKNDNCEILGCADCADDGHWWGGNLEGLRCGDVTMSANNINRLVYSPHVYGPSVYNQPYFSDPNFPNNLPYIYTTHWGFAINQTGRALVIGEWGGPLTGNNLIVQQTQCDYYKNNGITSSFYWALNPNPGGDTDGVLQGDWTTPTPNKISFLQACHPAPTVFYASGSLSVCMAGATATVPPTKAPTAVPPTKAPTPAPGAPTKAPTVAPTPVPPTMAPTMAPTNAPAAGAITLTLNSGSNAYWVGVTVGNENGATTAMWLHDSTSSTWLAMSYQQWGAWTFAQNTQLVAPISIKLTNGATTIIANNVFSSFTDTTTKNSGGSYSGGSSPTSAAPTTAPTNAPTSSSGNPTTAPPSGGAHVIITEDNGANMWWFAAAVTGGTHATTMVEVHDSTSTAWHTMVYSWGSTYVYAPQNSPLVAPLVMRVTGSNGAQALLTLSTIQPGKVNDVGPAY